MRHRGDVVPREGLYSVVMSQSITRDQRGLATLYTSSSSHSRSGSVLAAGEVTCVDGARLDHEESEAHIVINRGTHQCMSHHSGRLSYDVMWRCLS